MQFIADLEVHSQYARAVSPQMTIVNIALWAKKKGIEIVGTGDFTHPFRLNEIKNSLEEVSENLGCYKLKKGISEEVDRVGSPLFILSGETSHIFSLNGKTKRIHLLIYAPSIEMAENLNRELSKRGNLMSDGRPVLGLPCYDFLALALSIHQDFLIIPAHVWTPWFGLYGANGGVDSLQEVFKDLSSYIYAVETGLSSDPAMNWRIEELENRRIVSFSDAHSLEKLGREATVFEKEEGNFSYQDLIQAIRGNKENITEKKNEAKIAYTIEFFPEEGKYHYTGHRNCGVVQKPEEAKLKGTICPVCSRSLTVGVMHRVEELGKFKVQSSRLKVNGLEMIIDETGKHPPFVSTVPLQEILAESLGVATGTQKVQAEYDRLVETLGSEFEVLLRSDIEEIAKVSGGRVAEGIKRVREGRLTIEPGYDGVFGKVKIFGEDKSEEKSVTNEQQVLF